MEETFWIPEYYLMRNGPSLLDYRHDDFANIIINDEAIIFTSNLFINTKVIKFKEIKEMAYGKWAGSIIPRNYFSITLSKPTDVQGYFFLISENKLERISNLLKSKGIKKIDDPPYLEEIKNIQTPLLMVAFIVLVVSTIIAVFRGIAIALMFAVKLMH